MISWIWLLPATAGGFAMGSVYATAVLGWRARLKDDRWSTTSERTIR